MYSDVFCRVYNELGWNYFPEAFAEELLQWLTQQGIAVKSSLDLACGSGALCEKLREAGIAPMGMDLSEGMIKVAKSRCADIPYEVADMRSFRTAKSFDLVTCTGDSLNHILDFAELETVFRNVHACLNPGGHFIFDILRESEVPPAEPFDFPFDDTITARFSVEREGAFIRLKVVVFENGEQKLEEVITETLHDIDAVCVMLEACGFEVLRRASSLTDDGHSGTTCYIIAKKV